MQDIVLIGSGGCMREIVWQIQELNKVHATWNVIGYVDNEEPENGTGVVVGEEEIPYLGNDNFLLQQTEPVNVAISVGFPEVRKKIVKKLAENPNIQYPNLILGDTRICTDIKMGKGCIISMGVQISTNVKLGDFVFLNIGSTICHDGFLEDYATLNPDVKLAGNVHIGECCNIGLGTKIIQGLRVGANSVLGAGSVVVTDIEANSVAVGVPARKIKNRE